MGAFERERCGWWQELQRRLTSMACLAAAGLMLAACSGESSHAGSVASAPVAGTSKASTSDGRSPGTIAPQLPTEAERQTSAGAEEFFRYFWKIYNYSFKVRDSSRLRSISNLNSCHFCKDSSDRVDQLKIQGRSFQGGEVDVVQVMAPGGDMNQAVILDGLINQGVSRVLASNGSTATSHPQNKRVMIEASEMWENGRWVMEGIDHEVKSSPSSPSS